MATDYNSFVNKIVLDFTVDGSPLFSVVDVKSVSGITLSTLNSDLSTAYAINETIPATPTIEPSMTGVHYEMWELLTKARLYQTRAITSAERISFTSGDKKMDRSKEFANWTALSQQALDEYSKRRDRITTVFKDLGDAESQVYRKGAEATE